MIGAVCLVLLLDAVLLFSTITLTISVNNVIVLINFLSLLFLIAYELLSSVLYGVEITLLIVMIYSSAFLCLFLMNGFMFMSSLLRFNNFYCIYCVLSINSYFDNLLFVCFPSIWSVFLISWNRFANVVFDNDLLMLTVFLFWGVSFNLKIFFNSFGLSIYSLIWDYHVILVFLFYFLNLISRCDSIFIF